MSSVNVHSLIPVAFASDARRTQGVCSNWIHAFSVSGCEAFSDLSREVPEESDVVGGSKRTAGLQSFFFLIQEVKNSQYKMSRMRTSPASSLRSPSVTEFSHDLRRGRSGSHPSPPLNSNRDIPNDLTLQHARIVRHLCNQAARPCAWRGTGSALAQENLYFL